MLPAEDESDSSTSSESSPDDDEEFAAGMAYVYALKSLVLFFLHSPKSRQRSLEMYFGVAGILTVLDRVGPETHEQNLYIVLFFSYGGDRGCGLGHGCGQ